MAAFLRKKITPDAKPVTRQGEPSSDQPPPLFAKFATTYQGKASSTHSPRLVSSPMPLSNNSRRRGEHGLDYSRPHASGEPVFWAGSRGEKEGDAKGRVAASSTPTLVDPTLGPTSSPNNHPNHRQPRGSNSGAQPRQDRPLYTATKPVSRPALDKPLPNVQSSSPPPPPSSIPTNRGAPAPVTAAHNDGNAGQPTSSHTEKPLPQPSKTPPPPKPHPAQRQDREAELTGFGDPPRNVDGIGGGRTVDDGVFPSVPVKHGPAYSLIAPKAPSPAKSLPLMPEEPLPTPNLISVVDRTPVQRHPSPYSPPTQPARTPSHEHGHRRHPATVDPSHEVTAANHNPPDIPGTDTATRGRSQNHTGQSPRDTPEPWRGPQDYDDINVNIQPTPSRPPVAHIRSDQPAWLALHTDTLPSPSNPSPLQISPSETHVTLGHSTMGASTSSLSSPASPPTPRSNSGKSRTLFTQAAPEEHTTTIDGRIPRVTTDPVFQPVLPLQPRKASSTRSVNSQYQRTAPVRGKPLIFAAMATMEQTEQTDHEQAGSSLPSTATLPDFDFNQQGSSLYPQVVVNNGQQNHGRQLPPSPFTPDSVHHQHQHHHPSAEQPGHPPNRRPEHIQPSPKHPPPPSRKLTKVGLPTRSATTDLPAGYTSTPVLGVHASPSRTRTPDSADAATRRNHSPHRVLTKSRSPPPMSSDRQHQHQHQHQHLHRHPPATSQQQQGDLDHRHETPPNGMALALLDNDPFARADGVKMLKPTSTSTSTSSSPPPSSSSTPNSYVVPAAYGKKPSSRDGPVWGTPGLNGEMRPHHLTGPPQDAFGLPVRADNTFHPASIHPDNYHHNHQDRLQWSQQQQQQQLQQQRQMEPLRMLPQPPPPLVPPVAEAPMPYHHQGRGGGEEVEEEEVEEEEEIRKKAERKTAKHTEPLTLVDYVSHACVLAPILAYLSFYDWCVLSSVSKRMRALLGDTYVLREVVLERYLSTVGYRRWGWDWSEPDPLPLSLQDLTDYMRGVSIPTHEYARIAEGYIQSGERDPETSSFSHSVAQLTSSSRTYTRVVLRLRAQAEAEQKMRVSAVPQDAAAAGRAPNGPGHGDTNTNANANGTGKSSSPPPPSWNNGATHGSSRAPSPAQSLYSQGHSAAWNNTTNNNNHLGAGAASSSAGGSSAGAGAGDAGSGVGSTVGGSFRSPLFRLGRAPLLRVFVPSPEGDWLSDKSVLRCEAELRHAGVLRLMRAGDVVWDVAVGDEGNVGRMVWDGSFLIDLDYTYTAVGDLPKYMHALAFSPSYFHKVIRTGPANGNPIVHIDISPWGEEIAVNLQLLQDRIRMETPQGTYHNVVRWVHRSSFLIQRPAGRRTSRSYTTRARPPSRHSQNQNVLSRLVIPGTDGLSVDPGWYGTVVVEAEGTNEGLADLQDRCGPGVFPPRAGASGKVGPREVEARKVFRILRERSRPGEIWIRTVREKERLL